MFRVLCFKHRPHSRSWEQFCILWSDDLAWHFFFYLPILLQRRPSTPLLPLQTGFGRQPSPASFKSLQTLFKPFSPEAGTQTNGIIWVWDSSRSQPPTTRFFSILKFFFCEMGKTKGQGHWSASLLAELNRGTPFMAVYEHGSSKTHIQITSSFPTQWLPAIPGWWWWWQGWERVGVRPGGGGGWFWLYVSMYVAAD